MILPRRSRKLLQVSLGLVGFLLLVVALLPSLVSLDRVKERIVRQLEAMLQRPVDVGAVRLQLWGGLGAGLEDVTIYNPPGWQQPHVLKAATLSIKVAWRPFLQRRVEITKLILRDGEIVIERDPQGRLNVADVSASTPASGRMPSVAGQRLADGGGTPPGSTPLTGLRLSDVTMQNMPLTFVDRMVVPGQTFKTAVGDLQLHLRDVALGSPIPIELTATLLTESRRNLRLRGHLGPIPESLALDRLPIAVHLHSTDMRLVHLTPYLGRNFPLVGGRLEAEAALEGSIGSGLRLSGHLTLAEARLREGIMGDASPTLPTLTSTPDISVDLPAGRADLTAVEIKGAGIEAVIRGVVHTFTTAPRFDVQLATNTFTAEALLAQFPMLARRLPMPTDARGRVQFQATITGTPHDLQSEARIELQEMALKSGAFAGGAPEGGGLLLEADRAEGSLATHVVKTGPPRLNFDMRAQRLVFDQQAPQRPVAEPTPAPAAESQPKPSTQAVSAQPMLPPLALSGQLRVATGRVKNLTFQEMTADLNLVQGLLKSTQRMTLYGGSYQGTTRADLRQSEPSFSLDGRVAGLDVGRALNDLSPGRNGLRGTLHSDMRLAGRGLAWDAIQQTLSGDGHVKIAEAQLTRFDLVPKLLPLLQNLGGLVGFKLPSGWEDSPWRSIEGDWRLQHGKILTDALRLRREGMEALLSGHIGLDQTLEYRGTLFLPASANRRGTPLFLRQDEAGRIMVPFIVQGRLGAPRIVVDPMGLVGGSREDLVDTVRKRLGGKIEEFFGQPPAPQPPSQEPQKRAPESTEPHPRPHWPGKILQELFRR